MNRTTPHRRMITCNPRVPARYLVLVRRWMTSVLLWGSLGCELVGGIEKRVLVEAIGGSGGVMGSGGGGGCQAPGGEIDVDQSASEADIAASCTFRTLTAALEAARALPKPLTIRVAAGTYGPPAETPPFVVGSGVSVVGAGRDATQVAGVGNVPSAQGNISFVSRATVILRPDLGGAAARIADLAVMGQSNANDYGVWCDSGGPSTPGLPPAANAEIAGVRVSFAYVGVVATNSTVPVPSSCNLLLEDSEVEGCSHIGVWVTGAGNPMGGPRGGVNALVRGTTFRNNAGGDGERPAFDAWDNANHVEVEACTFEGNDVAMRASYHQNDEVEELHFRDNVVLNGRRAGIDLGGTAIVQTVTGNIVRGVSAPGMGPPWGVGLRIRKDEVDHAFVALARDNAVEQNDIGIELSGASSDFGTLASPGSNSIRDNTRYDVLVHDPSPTETNPLRMQGNVWNSCPPAAVPVTGAPAGADLVVEDVNTPVDVTNACP